jgi:hypothetical protein
MRLKAQKLFTEGDKHSNVKDRVGSELPQLDLVNLKKVKKELMGRKRKTPI